MGSRFIVSEEANVQRAYQQAIIQSRSSDTIRTEIYTGRPARALKNPYNINWEANRHEEKIDLLARGIIPWYHDVKNGTLPAHAPSPIPTGYRNVRNDDNLLREASIFPVGQACGPLKEIKTVRGVISELMDEFNHAIARFK